MVSSCAAMSFPEQLVRLRKERNLTQAKLANSCNISLPQLQRYETGKSQPTLDVIKRLCLAMGIHSDQLIFDSSSITNDDTLRLQFQAVSEFEPDEKQVAITLLESLIIRHDAQKWAKFKTAGAEKSHAV